jgi:hypothetical protein
MQFDQFSRREFITLAGGTATWPIVAPWGEPSEQLDLPATKRLEDDKEA